MNLFDPLYRAPFLGSMLMCLAAALMGALMFVKRRSLLGETLSHAAYPGVVLSVVVASLFLKPSDPLAIFVVLGGAFLFATLGLQVVEKLKGRFKIDPDAALCLVLSLFLGLGVLIASRVQFTHPVWYQQSQVFIYGQAATMTDAHIAIYGTLSLITLAFIIYRFREIERLLFDPSFVSGRTSKAIFFLLILSIVVGIRSVGVILIAGMLVAPAAAARSFTNRLSRLLLLSGAFGLLSGFGGNYLALKLSSQGLHYPTGPMILLFAASITLLSLLFAPQKGALSRLLRIARFRRRCHSENVLKTLWKGGVSTPLSAKEVLKWNGIGRLHLKKTLFSLQREGWVTQEGKGKFLLTSDGVKRAERLVRLHRLWELYLVSCLKVDEERVHHSAEEMEHILTPELENRLSALLNNPKKDPHQKPIPQGETL
ncbi:metal ABC transporter permease [Candidatus Neptunochlamydia vexilliferae]|uniref:Metal transport system membrane protein n=1 Tax=Candidatus Neptunichlamydia vexilliferae TaxID=1651774 RepID=A0ABS0AXQ3_9BACT|nr:metal ABC transporter permease [Candidatus Neptunochlamydia vexilliferae]MBF5058922.1 putative metal transport system membrane protein [Candidatus Neptunochlamydia vexilliferae]